METDPASSLNGNEFSQPVNTDCLQLNHFERILPTNEDSDNEDEEMSSSTDIIITSVGTLNEEEAESEEKEYSEDIEEKNVLLQIPKLSPSAVSSDLLSKAANSSSLFKHYNCDLCGRHVTSLGKLQRHLKMAHMIPEYKYQCHFCDKRFIHYWFYKNHLKNNHNGVEMIFSCQICNMQWHSQKELEEHKIKEHAAKIFAFKCRHCDIVFREIELLRTHLNELHYDSKEAQSARFNVEYLTQEESQPNNPEDKFPCRHCNRRFKTSTYCDIHILYEHRGITSCHVCKTTFRAENVFAHHIMITQHEQIRCSFCTMKVRNTSILVQHWEDQHSEIGKYSFYCEMCGLRFVTFSKLANHYSCHTLCQSASAPVKIQNSISNSNSTTPVPVPKKVIEEKKEVEKSSLPLPPTEIKKYTATGKMRCNFCYSTFAVRANLYNHVRKMHPEGANTFLPYKCPECNKNFPSIRGLTAHVRVHQALPHVTEIYFTTPKK